ncbi:MAG: restriction endonuclease subunit S [Saprospiraceae bacterium]|nr:restriction endonuclease subunit S [Saprospiraceae bacterium]
MTKQKLTDLTDISSGLFLKTDFSANTVYIQSKHFDRNGKPQYNWENEVNCDENLYSHFLQPGNVIYAAKGSKNFAYAIPPNFPRAVASTTFFVLKIKNRLIDPDYLCWFLNKDETQKFAKLRSKGTAIPSISKTDMEEILIPVPGIEKQKIILQLEGLRNKALKIRNEVTEKEAMIFNYRINKFLKI